MKKSIIARKRDVANHITAMAGRKSARRGRALRLGWKALFQELWDVEASQNGRMPRRAPRRADAKGQDHE